MVSKTKKDEPKDDVVERDEGKPAAFSVVARVTDPPEVPEPVRAPVSAGVIEVTIGGSTLELNREQAFELQRAVNRAVAVLA